MDEDFYGRFSKYLNQFARLLDAVYSLLNDFMDFSERAINSNLLDRRFVRLNALKCEKTYSVGVIILLLEAKFPGLIKERLFVAQYRSSANLTSRKFELLISILRNRRENFETCFQYVKLEL